MYGSASEDESGDGFSVGGSQSVRLVRNKKQRRADAGGAAPMASRTQEDVFEFQEVDPFA